MSSESYEKLKAILKSNGTLPLEEIEAITLAHGSLTDAELMALESMRLKIGKSTRTEVTMDDYLKAMHVLDETEEGSDAYLAAEAIVNAFESGG